MSRTPLPLPSSLPAPLLVPVLMLLPALLLALPVAPVGPAPASAQEARAVGEERARPDPLLGAGRFEVTALAGALAPLSRLSEGGGALGTELAASGLFSLDGVYWVGGRLGLGLRAAYAPATVSVVPGELAGAAPQELGPADYLSVSAEARVRFGPPGEGLALTPYLSAGAGVRQLDVRAVAGPEVEDTTDPLVTLAGGALLPLAGPVELRIELRDHLTFYETPAGESRLQNELAALVGASLEIP